MYSDHDDQKFKDGKYLTKQAKKVLTYTVVVLGFFAVVSGGSPQHIIGWQKTPGSFFEKISYDAKLYVFVNTDKNSTKNYKLPAEISKYAECDDSGEEASCSSPSYHLLSFTWPNGGYAEFDNCYIGLSRSSACEDMDGRSYNILLTGMKVN